MIFGEYFIVPKNLLAFECTRKARSYFYRNGKYTVRMCGQMLDRL